MVICLLRLDNSFIHNCRLRTKTEKGKRNRISRTFFNQCADFFICYRLFCCCCFAVVIAPSFSSSVAICFPHSIYDESFFNFCTGFVRFYSFFFLVKMTNLSMKHLSHSVFNQLNCRSLPINCWHYFNRALSEDIKVLAKERFCQRFYLIAFLSSEQNFIPRE